MANAIYPKYKQAALAGGANHDLGAGSAQLRARPSTIALIWMTWPMCLRRSAVWPSRTLRGHGADIRGFSRCIQNNGVECGMPESPENSPEIRCFERY